MRLLAQMIDSGLVKTQDYEIYFSKFLIEAKQELKKESINEKRKLIKKAVDKNLKEDNDENDDDEDNGYGNDKLRLYAKLLLPFWEINANIPPLFQQMLRSGDKKLKYTTLLLMIKENKLVSDSVLNDFASMDDYRYTLYSDLKEIDKLKLFPVKFNNKIDLARSKLISMKSYGKPDSILFIDKLPAQLKQVEGYVYFFKYKEKKDDPVWKLATVGLLSKDKDQLEIEDTANRISKSHFSYTDAYDEGSYDLTSFTETRLTDDKPITEQLNDQLKIALYSHRKSAKEFYNVSRNDLNDILRFRN
jgi:hypothetical protein